MSERPTLRLATRASALAMWQAEHVSALLTSAHPGLTVTIVPTTTEGDRRLDVPLSEIGGKGVFATEVQEAVLDGRADVAVHSAKDLTAVTAARLTLAAIPERGDPRDALVGSTLADLPLGAVVATGSARRRALLADARPDLEFAELRGNMATRLSKAEKFDAIVVAAVALERLGLSEHITHYFDPEVFVPQVAQAALGIECRSEDTATIELLAAIDHAPSRQRVLAERAFLAELGGDCSLPAGAHASFNAAGGLTLRGVLASQVGGPVARGSIDIPASSGADYDSAPNPTAPVAADSGVRAGGPGAELAAQLRDMVEAGR
ncbi:MAG TPA: hydroxymethylbilane synthase [Microthrixaceae bacterium]|nr:hydroxymethylbilane synthase [Microthrixaceae bacterium]